MSPFAKENSVPETWLKKEGTISITYQCNLHINTRIQINMRGGKLPSSVFGEEVLVFSVLVSRFEQWYERRYYPTLIPPR